MCLCGCFQVLLFAGMFSRVRGLCLGGPALPGARRLASGALSVIISSTSSLLPDTFLSTRAVGLTSQWAVPCSQVLAPWPVPSETRVCYRDLSRLQPTLLASGVSASESGPRGRHEVRGRLSGHSPEPGSSLVPAAQGPSDSAWTGPQALIHPHLGLDLPWRLQGDAICTVFFLTVFKRRCQSPWEPGPTGASVRPGCCG